MYNRQLVTGASNTCVGFSKLTHFKLTSKASEIKAAGAGAIDMETHISSKNKIEIGKWKNKKINIILFDLTHVNHALELPLIHISEPTRLRRISYDGV